MLNDDLISAYLDGELDAERRAEVERSLELDTGARARLERMRTADALLQQAFQQTAQDENAPLARLIMAPTGMTERNTWATRAAALAAALAIGLVLGQFVSFGENTATLYAITPDQAALLDTLPSGGVRETQFGSMEVVLSLRSDGGDLCRQFRLTSETQSTDVLACRSSDETWMMSAAAPASFAPEGYIPAGANSPLDAAIDALGPALALDENQERAMIEQGWK